MVEIRSPRPALLVVDDARALAKIERELSDRYGKGYRVVWIASAEVGLVQLERCEADGQDVALALDARTLDELGRLIAGTLVGAIEFRPALRHWTSERLETGVLGEVVRAGVDGEPITLEAPLRFSVDPGALRVLVPEGSPASRQMPPLEAGWHAARTLRRWLGPPSHS